MKILLKGTYLCPFSGNVCNGESCRLWCDVLECCTLERNYTLQEIKETLDAIANQLIDDEPIEE